MFKALPGIVASLLAVILGMLAGYTLLFVTCLILWPEETLYLLRTVAMVVSS